MGKVFDSRLGLSGRQCSDSESECGDDGRTGVGDIAEPPSNAQQVPSRRELCGAVQE